MKRRVLIIVIILLVISLALGIYTASRKNKSDNNTEPQVHTVNVSGAEQVSDYFKLATKQAINRAVAAHIEKDTGKLDGNYDLTYRQGSYSKTAQADGYPVTRVIIDIPKLQRSYVIIAEGDETTSYADIRVLCPAQNELIYPPQACSNND